MIDYDFSYTFQDVVKVIERFFKDNEGKTPSKFTKEEIEDYNNSFILKLYLELRISNNFSPKNLIGYYVFAFNKFSKSELKKATKYLKKNKSKEIKLPSIKNKIIMIILGIIGLIYSFIVCFRLTYEEDTLYGIIPLVSFIAIIVGIIKIIRNGTSNINKLKKQTKLAQKIPVSTNCPSCKSDNKQFVKKVESSIDWKVLYVAASICTFGIFTVVTSPFVLIYYLTTRNNPIINEYLCLDCNTTFYIRDYSACPKYKIPKELALAEYYCFNTIFSSINNEENLKDSNKNVDKNDTDLKNIESIREYKKLLDEGIITQEEFNMKKKQLLNN